MAFSSNKPEQACIFTVDISPPTPITLSAHSRVAPEPLDRPDIDVRVQYDKAWLMTLPELHKLPVKLGDGGQLTNV